MVLTELQFNQFDPTDQELDLHGFDGLVSQFGPSVINMLNGEGEHRDGYSNREKQSLALVSLMLKKGDSLKIREQVIDIINVLEEVSADQVCHFTVSSSEVSVQLEFTGKCWAELDKLVNKPTEQVPSNQQ